MKHFALLILLCLVGCQPADPKSSTETASDKPAQNKTTQDETKQKNTRQRRTYLDLVTVETVESSVADDARPKSPNDLVKMFVEQYQDKPLTAFANFYDWGDLPQEKRKTILAGLLSLAHSLDGTKTYSLIEDKTKLVTVEEYSRQIDMTASEYNKGRDIPCTHVLEVEMDMGEGTTSSGSLDIGTRDGIYYFYHN